MMEYSECEVMGCAGSLPDYGCSSSDDELSSSSELVKVF